MSVQVMLAAVHPWDTNGAKSAGLQAGFIARSGEMYPGFFAEPDLTVGSLSELASAVTNWKGGVKGGKEAWRH